MNISRYLRRIIAGDKVVVGGGMTLRNVIVWLFIAVVALFLTKPSAAPHSVFKKPLPLPAELHLE